MLSNSLLLGNNFCISNLGLKISRRHGRFERRGVAREHQLPAQPGRRCGETELDIRLAQLPRGLLQRRIADRSRPQTGLRRGCAHPRQKTARQQHVAHSRPARAHRQVQQV